MKQLFASLLVICILVSSIHVASGDSDNKADLNKEFDVQNLNSDAVKRNSSSYSQDASTYSLESFHNFMTKFSKKYSSIAEYRNRYNIFRRNIKRMLIAGNNQKTAQPSNLSDLTKAEIKKVLNSPLKDHLTSKNLSKIHKLEVGFCPGSPRPLSINLAKVSPFPVIIATGQKVTVNFKVTLNAVIPTGSTVSLKIKKHETWLPNIPIPCLEVHGQYIGSCTYKADFLLEKAAPFLCPSFFPPGQECKLPLKRGVYGGGHPLVLGPIREVPEVITDLLATGEYDAEVNLKNGSGKKITCLIVKVRLTHN